MIKKPRNISIGVNEPVTIPVGLAAGLQHTFAMSSTLVMASLIVGASGESSYLTHELIRMTMIVVGLGTILQSITRGPVGSGYLCPSVPGPGFLPASILAAKTGGLSLVFGMLLLSGAVQILLSRVVQRLRTVLPPPVTGVIIAMVGMSLVPIGVSFLTGLDVHDIDSGPPEVMLGIGTLAVMYGFTVWGGRYLRPFSVLLAILVGYAAALVFDLFPASSDAVWQRAEFVGVPRFHAPWDLSFDVALIIPFLIAGLVPSVKAIGVLTTCQKINDANWSAVDMKSLRGGLLASGISVIFAGLLGGMGPAASSSNVGLSLATGITSRMVGFFAGSLFILFAFSPQIATVFVLMPAPVKGAVLIYVACFMIVSGMEMIMSSVVNVRTIFIVGTSIVAGLSIDFVPQLYARAPVELHAFTGSPLAFATVVAIVLNLVLRIGVTRRADLEIDLGKLVISDVTEFMERCGSDWGLRRALLKRASDALVEVVDVALAGRDDHKVRIDARFDQVTLDLHVHYHGDPIVLPDRPPHPDELTNDAKGLAELSGYLIGRAATEFRQHQKGEEQLLHLRFAQ